MLRTTLISLPIILLFMSQGASAASIQHLSFLSGCWANSEEGEQSLESWFRPSESKMLGISQSVSSEGTTIGYEFLRIESDPTNEFDPIVYTPIVRGRPAAPFVYKSALSLPRETRAVFKNDVNQFPKKIEYFKAGDELQIELWGHDGDGNPMTINYTLESADCSDHH